MRGAFGHYLPEAGVKSLHTYSYVSGHKTPFDIIFNYWWEAVEKLVPRNVHPNTLTVCSCLSALLGSCLFLGFCPYLSEFPPRWAFLGAAALFFLYQTFDAIDGKHARRLGLSSPLGQLMDHGCDILSTTPLTLLGTALIGAGVGIRPYLVMVLSSQMLQFLYTWWELHFHVFYTATGAIGVTEAQLFVMGLAVIGGTFGPEIYHVDLQQYLPLALGNSIGSFLKTAGIALTPSVLIQFFFIIFNFGLCSCNIIMGLKQAPQFALAAGQVFMFIVYLFVQGTVYMHCLVWRPVLSPYLVYTTICSTYSILLLRLCLSATCRFPYKLVQWPMMPLALAATALRFCDLTPGQEQGVLLAVCIFNCMYLVDFVYTVVSDVCDGLSITCFTVPSPDEVKETQKRLKETAKVD
ncbi:hypothetical protein Emed_003381 [Eimeria media]